MQPLVRRGLVHHWPVVAAGERSPQALKEYLAPFDAGGQIEVFIGAPLLRGG